MIIFQLLCYVEQNEDGMAWEIRGSAYKNLITPPEGKGRLVVRGVDGKMKLKVKKG